MFTRDVCTLLKNHKDSLLIGKEFGVNIWNKCVTALPPQQKGLLFSFGSPGILSAVLPHAVPQEKTEKTRRPKLSKSSVSPDHTFKIYLNLWCRPATLGLKKVIARTAGEVTATAMEFQMVLAPPVNHLLLGELQLLWVSIFFLHKMGSWFHFFYFEALLRRMDHTEKGKCDNCVKHCV